MGKDLKGKELGKGIILKAVTEGTTFVVLKSLYGIPCERDMFYDRRRKFYFVLSGVREIYKLYYEKDNH